MGLLRTQGAELVADLAWCEHCGAAIRFVFDRLGRTLERCDGEGCPGNAPHHRPPDGPAQRSHGTRAPIRRPTLSMVQL